MNARPDIFTAGGNYFELLAPTQSVFDIADIAAVLSKLCHFGGHTRRFYSVAQHSVLMSYHVPPADAYAALMHDTAQAFVGDMPRPLKELLPEYRRVEKGVGAAVMERFQVPLPLPESVEHFDRVRLATEQRDLMPPHDDEWPQIAGIEPLSTVTRPGRPTRPTTSSCAAMRSCAVRRCNDQRKLQGNITQRGAAFQRALPICVRFPLRP
ncbi:hypothetical protein [Pseudacidovorax sp. NFM-22]|uniref:hypothetical protein n=1 Tax=Pseudacidovorax sp. NFM-22 TaxID=2744469 RepID=UPI001F2A7173|nr:hypothetical protein [Pseudacidovorax sp. NFM-22]